METDLDPQTERRVQLAVLRAVAATPALHDHYVLKGGLALHLAYGSPRRSHDLDFNAVGTHARALTVRNDRRLLTFCQLLDDALAAAAPAAGFAGLVTQDHRLSSEIPVMMAQVGFTDDPAARPPFPQRVPLQATLNEEVCAHHVVEVAGIPVRVPTLEDILAEKLKAMMQQVRRDSPRSSDVWDVWHFVARADGPGVDREWVARCLDAKSRQWPRLRPLSADRFAGEAMRATAAAEYEAVAARLPAEEEVPFDEAYDVVLRFVQSLPFEAAAGASS